MYRPLGGEVFLVVFETNCILALDWYDVKGGENGSVPLGNGDISSNTWICNKTGDLMLYVAKSDAVDEFDQQVKANRVRIHFSPSLWNYEHYVQNKSLFHFNHNVDLGIVSITSFSNQIKVKVFVDANSPTVYIKANTIKSDKVFNISVAVEIYRLEPQVMGDHRTCNFTFTTSADHLIDSNAYRELFNVNNSLLWYHKNTYSDQSRSYYKKSLEFNKLNMKYASDDDREDLMFGGNVRIASLDSNADLNFNLPYFMSKDQISVNDMKQAVIQINLLTNKHMKSGRSSFFLRDPINDFVNNIDDQIYLKYDSNYNTLLKNHFDWWKQFWNKSFIRSVNDNNSSSKLNQVIEKYKIQRFMDLCDGRNNARVIKFNGQAFIVNSTGLGPDYRKQGQYNTIQKLLFPYYAALHTSDVDVLLPVFSYFQSMTTNCKLLIHARYSELLNNMANRKIVQSFQLKDLPDFYFSSVDSMLQHADDIIFPMYFPETHSSFGTFQFSTWGCENKKDFSSNALIRFHYTGTLEICNLLLDYFLYYDDGKVLQQHLNLCHSVLLFFKLRFQNLVQGKIDMFPSQALQTWTCNTPTNRSDCVTNPTNDIAGLRTILQKLIQIDHPSIQNKTIYEEFLAKTPEIEFIDTGDNRKVISAGSQLPPKPINVENAELYSVFPFYQLGLYRKNYQIALNTYHRRRLGTGSDGDPSLLNAASLGLVKEAKLQLLDRIDPRYEAKGARFPGFIDTDDTVLSEDHLAVFRIGLQKMLLQSVLHNHTILVFPAYPVEWNIHFKLRASLNTTVEAACIDGKLNKLVVTPRSRMKDVVVMNCRKKSLDFTSTVSVS